ncbi:hypothetical protein GKZ90_0004995 [Flavobacterium sp. MC2016-06]|jgi:hypothetical protein|uniref:hypothetical protein n=1 Tax=Flavobacterium sp. MC2016-06 TaxID=2676308 RepID=UPI0012BAE871|nr:hypothetical protein [Flavobacterium sp. MC2016-06]MBU3862485.1 hypothetical protein [Flavobacterium sp. MC2016-06]
MGLDRILIALLILSLTSCVEPKHSIEIYLLKERIKSNEGIPVDKIKNFDKIVDTVFLKTIGKTANYDTIKKEFIYAGRFEVNSNQIELNPLINDSEIINLNVQSSNLKFSESAIKKIKKLKAPMQNGIQFVICDNKKPLFSGYFWNSYSSYGSTWNCIEYNNIKINEELKIYKGNGIDATKRISINFADSKELIDAFRATNRLTDDVSD